MSKDELIQKIELMLIQNNDLEVTDKQRLAIAKHIAKMPKKARIAFINFLSVAQVKVEEYDQMCHMDDEDYDPKSLFADSEPDWNK